MKKTIQIEGMLESLANMAFGRSRAECLDAGLCVKCGSKADKFSDEISEREYHISGLCQPCQDIAFAEDDEDISYGDCDLF